MINIFKLLDLDEATVGVARLKLQGIDFDALYGDEDSKTPLLRALTESAKIGQLFGNSEEFEYALSSPELLKEAEKDMLIDGIDFDFIKSYCKKANIELYEFHPDYFKKGI